METITVIILFNNLTSAETTKILVNLEVTRNSTQNNANSSHHIFTGADYWNFIHILLYHWFDNSFFHHCQDCTNLHGMDTIYIYSFALVTDFPTIFHKQSEEILPIWIVQKTLIHYIDDAMLTEQEKEEMISYIRPWYAHVHLKVGHKP